MRPTELQLRSDRDGAVANGARAGSARRGRARGGSRPGPGLTVELDPGPAAASEARAALTVLDGRIDRGVLDDIRLLVSELVTNSVRHSGAAPSERVCLNVASAGRTVRVEVSDGGCGFEPRERTKPRDEAGGWGLHLVAEIAARWGVQTGRRTRVWFEIDS